ncbi:MAG: hypothetical protein U9R25_04605 [Chloroflexota bacterium]|nr:hypothetical protein [Chloroflexota bacterium]
MSKEETQETVAEDSIAEVIADLELEIAESKRETEPASEPEMIVVRFTDEKDAEDAIHIVNKALRKRNETIYQGALVTRGEDNELHVRDLRDMGLFDIITGTVGLTFDLGRGGLHLMLSAAMASLGFFVGGWRLLRNTASRSATLVGSTWTIPKRRQLESFEAGDALESSDAGLEPGTSAVVIVADHETASELATDLVRSGGEIS